MQLSTTSFFVELTGWLPKKSLHYLWNWRRLPKTRTIIRGFTRAILWPDVWNISYDELLLSKKPWSTMRMTQWWTSWQETWIIPKCDWIKSCVELPLEGKTRTRGSWLKNGDCVSHKKCINTLYNLWVINGTVQYLSVMFDNKLIFGEEIRRAADKAGEVRRSLCRIIANIHRTRHRRIHSVIWCQNLGRYTPGWKIFAWLAPTERCLNMPY